MLHVIQHLSDPLISLIKDDPVRPEISLEQRVTKHSEIFVLVDSQADSVMPKPSAVVCVAYRAAIPSSVSELLVTPAVTGTAAIFYTIWSYRPGAGRRLIREARAWIEQQRSHVDQFVTLSPCTDTARQFHLRNGAVVYRINEDSVNYVYP